MSNPLQLATSRLLLRPWREADREPFVAMNQDPRVMRFFAAPYSAFESNEATDRYNMQLIRDGFTMFAAEERATNSFVGTIGMQIMRDAIPGLKQPVVEVGWRLTHAAQGRGYATEGARAIVDHAFRVARLQELIAITVFANTPSRRVMEKLGMVNRPELTFQHPRVPEGHPYREHLVYSLSGASWILSPGGSNLASS